MNLFKYLSMLMFVFMMIRTTDVICADDQRMSLYDVQHYDLTIAFDLLTKTFSGSVTVQALTLKNLDQFVLSASDSTLTIDSVFFASRKTSFDHTNNHLIVHLLTIVPPEAEMEVRVFYHGSSNFTGQYESGGVYFDLRSGSGQIATSSEPYFARTWWPCKDVPSDKATAQIHITVPGNFTAVSNGILKTIDGDNKTKTYSWETTYPIATYLISVAAAEYQEFSDVYLGLNGEKMKISYYVFPYDYEKAKIDFYNTKDILNFFSTKFCEYPFIKDKFGYAEVTGDVTMENQTVCSIEDRLITGTHKSELTLVHEIAHHWWGNMITPRSWQHTWLSEGFATYAEALYLENSKGHDAYQNYIWRMMSPLNGAYAGSVVGLSDTSFWDSFAPRVYYKGALVLHMLRKMIGDEKFFTIMKNYLNNPIFRYANASTEDFINECEKVYGKSLRWFFNQWVYVSADSIDRPEIEYSWTSRRDTSKYEVMLTLVQTTADKFLYRLPLPIRIITHSSSFDLQVIDSLATQSFTFSVTEQPQSIEIDKDKTIFRELKRKEN